MAPRPRKLKDNRVKIAIVLAMIRLYTPIYAFTLLLSAALLFSVQPMFSKMILPMLGGTPQVWNTAMLFFQLLLLAGYAYAHGTTRLLGLRGQAVLHLALLVVFAFVLPIAIPAGWTPPVNKDPTFWQLSLMTITVGGPFFVLSGSAPMLQRWFAATNHKDAHNPYFLYGASNLGSMSALLAYPVLIEPLLNLNAQSQGWMYGYIVLGLLTALCTLTIWQSRPAAPKTKKRTAKTQAISWQSRMHWILLAAIPSSLMLGVTTFITTDVASVPLLWVLPLALYVGTFIIVFARRQFIQKNTLMSVFGLLLIGLLVQMTGWPYVKLALIPYHMVLFFVAALACHTELASRKPEAAHLTEFYLMMSIGGALGGFFNAIIAPNLFVIPFEYALALAGAALMRTPTGAVALTRQQIIFYSAFGAAAIACMVLAKHIDTHSLRLGLAFVILCTLVMVMDKRWIFGAAVTAMLLLKPPGHIAQDDFLIRLVEQDRSFFGITKVYDTAKDYRIMLHGTTNHGTQALDEEHKTTPLSYYHFTSPIADAFAYTKDPKKIAVLGLGVGVTACLATPRDHIDFFEIDPDVARIAQDPEYFSFLSACKTPYEIILGDARLTLADQPDAQYDLIFADAYSSDNIPVHLITHEAIELYLSKLKPGGILLFNISNNFLDIEPVLAEAAEALNIPAYARLSHKGMIEGTELPYYAAHGLIFARTPAQERYFEQKGWSAAMQRDGVNLWSDQFSNIVSVIGNKTGKKRFLAQKNADTE
ncbi:MAG: fused MFS/spermidine synthase [Alphaproteobacteria bacterium]|nr:fused MFS/spermidine synthase [Alphaproteobacteria bacterium]